MVKFNKKADETLAMNKILMWILIGIGGAIFLFLAGRALWGVLLN